jgi:hypothetical protein
MKRGDQRRAGFLMSTRVAACEQADQLTQDCEKLLRRDFQKRIAISIVCVALGVVGILKHTA